MPFVLYEMDSWYFLPVKKGRVYAQQIDPNAAFPWGFLCHRFSLCSDQCFFFVCTLELLFLSIFITYSVGQVIGSSGGVNFLAEFIVTSTSFLLGGVATISSSAVESWLVFASLSTAAFWGFLFARIGLLDGMKISNRTASSSFLLRFSVVLVTVIWVCYMLFDDWMAPCTVMLQRLHVTGEHNNRI